MKKFILFLILIGSPLFAQQYDKNWNKVVALENDGKIKSANEVVAKIHKNAIADKNEVQIIKCFFYESKYLQVVDENAQSKIINNLKSEINRASVPSKAILNLVYAKCLSDYRMNFETLVSVDDTTAVAVDTMAVTIDTTAVAIDVIDNSASNDSLNKFTDLTDAELSQIFAKTLLNEAVLRKTPLSKYEAIFDFFTLEKFKKESLFDYLLKENIAFYSGIINKWEIDSDDFSSYQDIFLGNSENFIKLNLDFIKNENLKTILTLFQKQESNTPTIDNQLERMQFCHKIILKEDDKYIKSLDLLKTKDSSLIQKIQLEKAIIYTNQASKEKNKDYNVRALTILDAIIAVGNNSNTEQLAKQQKQEISSKTVRVQLQKFSYTNENTRAFVTYKNVDQLKISFYKIKHNTILKLENKKTSKESLITEIIKNNPFKSTENKLENRYDYFEYTTEILLPPLETGSYLVYFETDSDPKDKKAYAYETITISNLSVLANATKNEEIYTVLDRKTGKPLENVKIQSTKFDIKTNANGIARFKTTNRDYDDETLTLSTLNDTIRFEKNYLYNNEPYEDKKEENYVYGGKVEFYLDRAIYRPGQTVYYKGIAIKNRKEKTTLVPSTTFKLTFRNSNNEIFKELETTTNEFGSFSGEIVLPKASLTGDFVIEANEPNDYKNDIVYDKIKNKHPFWGNVLFQNHNITFKVEEYKRPKFEVIYEAKKETFQINQTVKIKGSAKAFAGSNISDAKVTYTITRFANFYRNFYGNEQSEIITTEETKTDASGNFVIDFVAKPTPNTTKEQLPVFNYRINTYVTDINGETHSAETTVKVGYHDLILDASVPNRIETKDKNEITIKSTNLNGEFLATKGEIKLYSVQTLSTKFKDRIWQKPEIESISDEDFNRLFPYEQNEKLVYEDELGTLVFSKKVDTEKDKIILLDFISNYKSGHYIVVFSAKDKYGNEIEKSDTFNIIQSKDKLISNQLITITQLNENPKKDGFVQVKISSTLPELYLNTTGNYKNQLFFEKNIHLTNNETIVVIPLREEFKNTLALGFETVFENQKFTYSKVITLKENPPSLEFEVSSFRNKIEPGSQEKWSFQLKSNNTTKEAEVLASMYDSSLDQFTTENWNSTLSFYERYYNNVNFKTSLGFDKTVSYIQNLNPEAKWTQFQKEESSLKWFGFNFCKNRYEQDVAAAVGNGLIMKFEESIKGDADSVEEIAITRDLKDKNIGKESPNKITAVKLPPPPPKVDQVKFVKPVVAKAEDTTFEKNKNRICVIDGEIVSEDVYNKLDSSEIVSIQELNGKDAIEKYGSKAANGAIIITTKKSLEALTQVKARKNLSETAFFYPNLKTDAKGKVSFNFTSPEALTAWKLRLLAHNKEAVTGYLEKSIVTQKELMVVPNFPRFFREKDSIVITTKVSNITNEAKTGMAVLQLFDATTIQTLDTKMANTNTIKNFTIPAYGNTTVSWKIYIPEGLQGVQYKVLAKAGNFSDGEENILPVLTNSMLVTESIPIWVRENSKKEYTFENLKNNSSTTLRNHQFTLEYTSNPTWIAIQSLPYLMEYEHECAEQTFARFYANALASEIISSNPKIDSLFETWRKNGKLNSKLEENEELKSIILAETPWLNDAQNEDEKKKNLALLFDLEKMKTSQEATFNKLKQKQKTSGGFAWFDGSDENEYITRHILAGLGHLSKLSNTENTTAKIKQIATTGIPFLDQKFLENHQRNNPKGSQKMIWFNPYSDLHYLYTRSFYLENYPLSDTLKKATKLYIETAKKDWLTYSLYEKGMAALTLNRFGEKDAAKKIIESLKETASNNQDWGMYWIANKSGWYWYQAPIETQALLIEAFAEVSNDTKSVDAMKVWLLKNKQTKNWPTTKSTTEAIYALLMQGTDWLPVKDNTIIQLGNEKTLTKKLSENEKEAETGYVKLNWKADEIKKEMASISIENKSKVPGFGGIYWQYFEDLDKIKTNSGAVLSVAKELYLKKNTDNGEKLERISTNNPLKIGDLITVRLVISAKEDMEFVHLKDMRASCFEPVNVLSEYQYKGRLGFYQSTKDTATHFFFDAINKGTYVLEYDIRVNNLGDFSNGISTIESMYAPEFSSHTKGIRVNVKE